MTHEKNQQIEGWDNPDAEVVCDGCGDTSTLYLTADGSWEFVYDPDFNIAGVYCPTCDEARLKRIAADKRAERKARMTW